MTDNRYYRSTSVDLSSWLLVVTNLLQCGIRETNVGTRRELEGLILLVFHLHYLSFNGRGVGKQLVVEEHGVDNTVHLYIANSTRHRRQGIPGHSHRLQW